MEVSGGSEEGFVREWTPCSHVLNLIPPRIQTGIFSSELCLTCVDAVSEYIALGTNVGLVYWYDRKKGNIQRLRCEASNSPITYVKIVSTVDYMVGAGNAAGQVTVFQIPKEHPENIPDNFKPKVEPKVERYTIGELHKSKITAIEWSKNGMRLFSGDKDGVIIMTEIDFYMHLCKSMEIVNEGHEIVQLSYRQGWLLVSSVYRSIACELRDGRWQVNQLGKKERKSLSALGAVFQYSAGSGGAARLYCARPGLRVWRADTNGDVLQTLLFKEAISNPLTVAELLNPATRPASGGERSLGPLHVFREHFLVSHDDRVLYILDPRSLQAVACVDQLRRILSVSVSRDEIFVLEGPRSMVRLAHAPEPAPPEEPALMSKSLGASLQHAVNTVRELTQFDRAPPYIASVLDHLDNLDRSNQLDPVASAEECFELPPIEKLPRDLSGNVLESIVNEFRDTSETDDLRETSEELQRKLKLYNSIMEKKYDEEVIHSSRRGRRKDGGSANSTPRHVAPAPPELFTSPCLMNCSVFDSLPQQNDELLEKQIEEKEKILAKMLNLESLSITVPPDPPTQTNESPTHTHVDDSPTITYRHVDMQAKTDQPEKTQEKTNKQSNFTKKPVAKIKDPNPIDLIPRVVKLPNTWNLENMELKLDLKMNGFKDNRVISPDENFDSEWEFV